ncbi:hypothetical protein [Streptomyces asiaticus]|uniref:hypothetical protein n=1 Tax=Streptomyces asiaticus TaxID=114695 RepID=UPI003F66309E
MCSSRRPSTSMEVMRAEWSRRQASTLAEQERRCEEHAALVTELAGAPNSIARSMSG